ncbi:DMT family transporter [Caulobacter segnis]|uniref:DMT family transporter n=1 Tax=Caulobacter segnis TaxID=88688 RepID=UPI002410943F|nr:DMT family transporter [Caulobacter segnis]MDG2521978.1 DMT family transporter [Caulobacter segnis]
MTASTPSKPDLFSDRRFVYLAAAFCCVLWGSSYPAIKNGYRLLEITKTDLADQVVFAGYRFVLAGVMLLATAVLLRRPIFGATRRQFGQMALLGFFQTTLQYVFFYIGVANATGVKSSIMNATGAFFGVLIAHFVYANDRLTGRKALGCLVGFLGVLTVNLGSGLTDFDFTITGEGFVAFSAFILAGAAIYGKRISRDLDPMIMTGWQLGIGGLILTVGGMAVGGEVHGFDWRSASLLIYLGALSAAAFAIWSLLLKHNPVSLVAPFNFLIPVFGVILSAAFLHETVFAWKNLAALVLVCGGIWLVTRAGRRPA